MVPFAAATLARPQTTGSDAAKTPGSTMTKSHDQSGSQASASPMLRRPAGIRKPPPGFIQNDPLLAQSLARSSNALLLVVFCAPREAECGILDEHVFPKKSFIDSTRGMIKVDVDADSSASWDWKDRFKIGDSPTTLMTDSKLREIGRAAGYRTPGGMLRWIGDQRPDADRPVEEGLKHLNEGTPLQQMLRKKRIGLWRYERGEFAQATLLLDGLGGDEARKYALLSRERLALAQDKPDVAAQLLRALLDEFPDDVEQGYWLKKLAGYDKDFLFKRLDQSRRTLATWRNSGALDATRRTPGDLYEIEADLLAAAGKPEESRRVYGQAATYFEIEAKESPLSAPRGANQKRAELLEKAGNLDEAKALHESLLKAYGDEPAYPYAYAGMLYRLKEFDRAYPYAAAAEASAYGDNWLLAAILKAKIELAQGHADQARRSIEQTISQTVLPPFPGLRSHQYLAELKELLFESAKPSPAPRQVLQKIP